METRRFPDPIRCHLWNQEISEAGLNQFYQDVEVLKLIDDEPHLIRRVLKCPLCGQLYFSELYEETDLKSGDDYQYRMLIPIPGIEVVDELTKTDFVTILKYFPRLQWDYNRQGQQKPVWLK